MSVGPGGGEKVAGWGGRRVFKNVAKETWDGLKTGAFIRNENKTLNIIPAMKEHVLNRGDFIWTE